MKTMETKLREEIKSLEKIVKQAKEQLKTAPKGHLRVRKWNGAVEYYYNDGDKESSGNGRYLRKREENLARDIAQKDYDIRVIKNAEERVKAICTFLNKYEKTSLKTLYEKTNPCRRELINTPIISDEEYVRRWQKIEYSGKDFSDDIQEIITEKGERVRSKSEKIIADKLYALGISYRYEYPLVLEGNIKIYPDFTILKMPEREEVYLEHFGMMDDLEYVDSVMYKLNTYERNGIYLGVNLLITHETSRVPLNTRALDGLLRKMFSVD